MRKCIVLNRLVLTPRKEKLLNNFTEEYLKALEDTCLGLPLSFSTVDLHHATYSNIRKTSTLTSDVVMEARKDIWKMKRILEGRGYNGNFTFNKCSIRLNKRWFKVIITERGTLCFKITYAVRKTFVIPISKDRQFQRFNSFLKEGWFYNNISLLSDGNIAVVLEKEFVSPEITQRYVVGIDIGSSTLGAVSLFDTKTSKVVRQLYFGRDVAKRQRRYEKRRAFLKSLANKGSHRAKQHLRKLRRSQSNFVKTRSGQIACEIVSFAVKNNAYISVEKLKNLRAIRGKICKKGRKKINIIPYRQFLTFLESNCVIHSVPFYKVDAYHTSKWCSHCGAINVGHHKKNYSLYVCKNCKQIVNSDRKASLAVAVKSVLERKPHSLTNVSSFQISKTQVSVDGLLRSYDVGIKVTV